MARLAQHTLAAEKPEEIVQYLSVLEVDVHDAKMLFHILDDGDGLLTVQDKAFCRLGEEARRFV